MDGLNFLQHANFNIFWNNNQRNKFFKKFLVDNSITKYIYKNINFLKKNVDQSKFLHFFVVALSFCTKV